MTLWIILGIANIPVYIGIGWVIFDSIEGFLESLRYWFMPDIISALRGEYWEDAWGELKLWWWIAMCAGAVWVEHWALTTYVLG